MIIQFKFPKAICERHFVFGQTFKNCNPNGTSAFNILSIHLLIMNYNYYNIFILIGLRTN
jgi:hypothetical protein